MCYGRPWSSTCARALSATAKFWTFDTLMCVWFSGNLACRLRLGLGIDREDTGGWRHSGVGDYLFDAGDVGVPERGDERSGDWCRKQGRTVHVCCGDYPLGERAG